MCARVIFAVCLLFPNLVAAQGLPDSSLFEGHRHVEGGDTLPYLLYRSEAVAAEDTLPALVVFLHGAGERGNDNRQQLRHCVRFFLEDSVSGGFPFLMLLPQCPEGERWVNTDWRLPQHQMYENPTAQLRGVMTLVDSLTTAGAVDSSRIYFCGISMGGFGVWEVLQRWPQKIAAAIAICGGGDPAYARRMKDIPIYIFHGDKDKLVKPDRSRQMYLSLRRLHSQDLHYIHYPEQGHLCWDSAFSTPGLFKWLFNKRKQ